MIGFQMFSWENEVKIVWSAKSHGLRHSPIESGSLGDSALSKQKLGKFILFLQDTGGQWMNDMLTMTDPD